MHVLSGYADEYGVLLVSVMSLCLKGCVCIECKVIIMICCLVRAVHFVIIIIN